MENSAVKNSASAIAPTAVKSVRERPAGNHRTVRLAALMMTASMSGISANSDSRVPSRGTAEEFPPGNPSMAIFVVQIEHTLIDFHLCHAVRLIGHISAAPFAKLNCRNIAGPATELG
jgi:hypothetical protein